MLKTNRWIAQILSLAIGVQAVYPPTVWGESMTVKEDPKLKLVRPPEEKPVKVEEPAPALADGELSPELKELLEKTKNQFEAINKQITEIDRRAQFQGTVGTGAPITSGEIMELANAVTLLRYNLQNEFVVSNMPAEMKLVIIEAYFKIVAEMHGDMAIADPNADLFAWSKNFTFVISLNKIQDLNFLAVLSSNAASQVTQSIYESSLDDNLSTIELRLKESVLYGIEPTRLIQNPSERGYVQLLRYMAARYLIDAHNYLELLKPAVAPLNVDPRISSLTPAMTRFLNEKQKSQRQSLNSLLTNLLVNQTLTALSPKPSLIDLTVKNEAFPAFANEDFSREIYEAIRDQDVEASEEAFTSLHKSFADSEGNADTGGQLFISSLATTMLLTNWDWENKQDWPNKFVKLIAHAKSQVFRQGFVEFGIDEVSRMKLHRVFQILDQHERDYADRLRFTINSFMNRIELVNQTDLYGIAQKTAKDSFFAVQNEMAVAIHAVLNDIFGPMDFSALSTALRPLVGVQEDMVTKSLFDSVLGQKSYSQAQAAYFQVLGTLLHRTGVPTPIYERHRVKTTKPRIKLAELKAFVKFAKDCQTNPDQGKKQCPYTQTPTKVSEQLQALNNEMRSSEGDVLEKFVTFGEKFRFFQLQSAKDVDEDILQVKLNEEEIEAYKKALHDEQLTSYPLLTSEPDVSWWQSAMTTATFGYYKPAEQIPLYERIAANPGSGDALIEGEFDHLHERIQRSVDRLAEEDDLVELGNLVARSTYLNQLVSLQPAFKNQQSDLVKDFFASSAGLRAWDHVYDLYINKFFTYLLVYQAFRFVITRPLAGVGKFLKLIEDGAIGSQMKFMFVSSMGLIVADIGVDGYNLYGKQKSNLQETEDLFFSNLTGEAFVTIDSLQQARNDYEGKASAFWENIIFQVVLLGGGVLIFTPKAIMGFEKLRLAWFRKNLDPAMTTLGLKNMPKDILITPELIDEAATRAYNLKSAKISDPNLLLIEENQITMAKNQLSDLYKKEIAHWNKRGRNNAAEFEILGLQPGSWHPAVLLKALTEAEKAFKAGRISADQWSQVQRAYMHLSTKVLSYARLGESMPAHKAFIEGAWLRSSKMKAGEAMPTATPAENVTRAIEDFQFVKMEKVQVAPNVQISIPRPLDPYEIDDLFLNLQRPKTERPFLPDDVQ